MMVTSYLMPCQFAAFVLCVLMQGSLFKASTIDKECSTCATKECLFRAKSIMRNLKPDVDPCEDFFSFACGGYVEKFGKEDTRSVYDDTWYSLQTLIKDLLENLQPEVGTVSEKLKTVFDSCINKGSSELKAVPDALHFLNRVGIPNWPNLESKFEFAELNETLGRLAVYGEFPFINFQPSPYQDQESKSRSPSPVIILPGNYLLNSKINPKDVENSVMRILSYFNVDKRESEIIWKNFKTVEDIGIQLRNEESGNAFGCKDITRRTYATVNCSDKIQDKLNFLCQFWKSTVKIGNFNEYFSEDIIHISCRWNHFYYIENIFANLVNVSYHRSLADYLSLRFFISHMDDINLYFHLTKKTYPDGKRSEAKTPEPISRWEQCIGWAIKSMNLALGYEYTQKILLAPIQNNVLDMIQDYLQSLNIIIESQNWIEEKVKLFLRKQLVKLEIGFQTTMGRFRNQTALSNYYKEFQPVKESFFRNILEYGKALVLAKDTLPFNSFYSSSDPYTMDFGVALLLPPTYSYGLPKLWNYAALGSIIGHELSHNLKLYFDLVHLDDETMTSLNNKMQCFVNQYSRFTVEKTGKKINSNEATEEIIADNIGWELTEKILKDMIDFPENLNLPGLEYTAKQLAYISFVQDSCSVLSKDVENEFYSSKPHNLQKLRVLGMLQNSKMFSETFNCSTTKIMNPENKCTFFDELNVE